ncbi:MAG: hypothetical protein ACUVTD_03680 [Nitrososphaerales archaeon]
MKANINVNIHFAILDRDDNVADAFTGLRHYPSDLFVVFITADLFHELKKRVDNALENLKILIPDLRVETHNVGLKEYWGIFFKAHEIANNIAQRFKNVYFYANITTLNRIAAIAIRDALATIERPAICYYYIRGKSEEEKSEIHEVPVPPFSREMHKSVPILKSLYEKGGCASSIQDIARDVGEKISQSESFESQARLVEYYVRKLEVYAVVRTTKRREVVLTGSPLTVTQGIGKDWR